VISSNLVSIMHRFRDITTFSAVEKQFMTGLWYNI